MAVADPFAETSDAAVADPFADSGAPVAVADPFEAAPVAEEPKSGFFDSARAKVSQGVLDAASAAASELNMNPPRWIAPQETEAGADGFPVQTEVGKRYSALRDEKEKLSAELLQVGPMAGSEARQKEITERQSAIAGEMRTMETREGRVTDFEKLMRDAAGLSYEVYRADPKAQNLAAQLGRGAGAFYTILPTLLVNPAVGLPAGAATMAGETYGASYREKEAEMRGQGITDQATIEDEAATFASGQTEKVVPALAAYMVGGKIAAGITSKILGEAASPVVKALAGTGSATLANVTTGTVLRSLEDPEQWKPTIETLTMDTLFGIAHGVGEYRTASNQASRRANEEIARRQRMQDIADAAKQAGMDRTAEAAEKATQPKPADEATGKTEVPPPTEPPKGEPPSGQSEVPPSPTVAPLEGQIQPVGPKTETRVADNEIVEVPLGDLSLSEEVPQFKSGADERGIVKPLEGKFDRRGAGPIQVWRRADGKLEIISGRHRFDLAKRSGEETIPAQIYDEAKGFDAKQAAMLDAELNIRDEQGSVSDYANYFRNSGITEEEAVAKGLLGRAKGKAGFSIGKNASDDLYALHQSGKLTDAAADAVANAAPGDAGLQAVGTRAAMDGKSAEFSGNLVKAYRARLAEREGQPADPMGDLFGFDDAAIKQTEADAKRVSEIQRGLRSEITTLKAMKNVAKNPEKAREHGVDVNDPAGVDAAVKRRIATLESELERWDGDWFMQPDLMAKLRAEPTKVATAEPPKPPEAEQPAPSASDKPTATKPDELPKLRQGEKQGDLLANQTEDLKLVGEKGVDAVKAAEEKAAAEKASAEAKAQQDRDQGTLLSPAPAAEPQRAPASAAEQKPGSQPVEAPRVLPRPLDVQMEGAGNVSIPQVMRSFERVVQSLGQRTPIRIKRFFQNALGIYKPHEKVARLANAGDIAVAAHEIAHGMQDAIFHDTNSAILHRSLPAPVANELVALGRALYGPTAPHNGYASEGFAELMRFYLTTDEARLVAPRSVDWIENSLLPSNPELRTAFTEAKRLADTWRREGALNRATAQMQRPETWMTRARRAVSENFSSRNWIEEFQPLQELAREYERVTGRPLTPASNPYEMASSKRGVSGAVVMQMVDHGMVDPFGNPMRDGSGRLIGSLREALAPIGRNENQFAAYLWARRALHLHRRNIDPGMSVNDAQHLLTTLGNAHPEFAVAADNVYRWQDGVLEYLAIGNPALRPAIERIRNRSFDYVPLQRVIDAREAKTLAHSLAANPLARIRGSGRPVRYIFDQILANTNNLVAASHRSMVLDSIVRIAETGEGLGYLIEAVPRDPVRNRVNFEDVRRQLEDLGIDTTAVDPADTVMLEFFTRATDPKGADPVVSVQRGDQTRWYQVNKELYGILEGLEPQRMHWLLSPLVLSARAFRLGTTGLRASFSLWTNPVRDAQTFAMQNLSTNNPARLASAYLYALGERIMSGAGGNRLLGRPDAQAIEMFRALGIEGAQPLGIDINFTRKTARGLFNNAVVRRVRSPIEAIREALGFTESVPRIAAMELAAREAGWTPGTPITPDQAVAIANAGKRVTVDFSAGGRVAKLVNQMIPFFNATIQGTRSFARTFQRQPVAASLKALTYFVMPSIALWYANKDKKWYQNLPWREKYMFWNFEHPNGKDVIQLPKPQEWGNIAALTEGAFDSWYRQDAKAAEEAVLHTLSMVNPADYPPTLRTAKEQWENRIEFWDRPIVPRAQIDLPPGEQVSEYGSEIGKALGRAFPDKVSPRRVDAAVKSLFGGTGGDVINGADALMRALGIESKKGQREGEASDFPVLGRMFRRGGTTTQQNQAIADFYDEWVGYGARAKSKENKLTGGELGYWQRLDAARKEIKVLQDIAEKTTSQVGRQRLYESIADRSSRVLRTKPKH